VFDRRSAVLWVFEYVKDASVVLDQAEGARGGRYAPRYRPLPCCGGCPASTSGGGVRSVRVCASLPPGPADATP
jgi:hypothetical protein